MTNLIKRLYVKTKFKSAEETEKWAKQLRKKGFLKASVCSMQHYKPSKQNSIGNQAKTPLFIGDL